MILVMISGFILTGSDSDERVSSLGMPSSFASIFIRLKNKRNERMIDQSCQNWGGVRLLKMPASPPPPPWLRGWNAYFVFLSRLEVAEEQACVTTCFNLQIWMYARRLGSGDSSQY